MKEGRGSSTLIYSLLLSFFILDRSSFLGPLLRVTSTFVDGQRHLSGTNTHTHTHTYIYSYTPRTPFHVAVRPMSDTSGPCIINPRERRACGARTRALLTFARVGRADVERNRDRGMHLESSGNFENGAPGRLSTRVCPLAHRESLRPDINIQGPMVLAGKTWPSNFSQFASRVWRGSCT